MINASIINYTSIAGWNAGGPGAGVYGTSKAAVHALTRALAKDLAEYGIRVNAVSPGTIDTDFHKVVIVDQFCQSSINKGVKQNFLLSHRLVLSRFEPRSSIILQSVLFNRE